MKVKPINKTGEFGTGCERSTASTDRSYSPTDDPKRAYRDWEKEFEESMELKDERINIPIRPAC
jgi:hypothetical protein